MSLTILIALVLLAGGVGYFFYDRHQNKKQEQYFEELRAKRKSKRESAAKKQAAGGVQRKKDVEAPAAITHTTEHLLDPAVVLSTSSQTPPEGPAQDDANAHWWDPPPPTAEAFNTPTVERIPLPPTPVQPPVKGIVFQDDEDLLPVSESLDVAPPQQTSAVLEDVVEETPVSPSTQDVQDGQEGHLPTHLDKPAESTLSKAVKESAVASQIVIDDFQDPAASDENTFNRGLEDQGAHTPEGSPSAAKTQSTEIIPLEEVRALDSSAPATTPLTDPLTEDFPSVQDAPTVEEVASPTPAEPLSSGVVVEDLPHRAIQEDIDVSDDILDELVAEEERSAPASPVESVSTDVVEFPKETTSHSTQEVVQEKNIADAPSEPAALVDEPVVVELPHDLSHAAEETSALPTQDAVSSTTSDPSKGGVNASDELAALLGSDDSSLDFNLPFDNDLDKLLAPISSETSAVGGESPAPSVLLVDDSRSFRTRMGNILKEGGCQVTACANGQEAFDLLRSAKPPRVDVIISDIDMPEMDGYTFFTALQAQGNLKSIPFIVVTGSYENVEKANRLGIKEALVKPFGEKEIEDALRRLIPQFF